MNVGNPSRDALISLRQELLAEHNTWHSSSLWIPRNSHSAIQSWILPLSDGRIPLVRAESILNCSASVLFDYLVTNIDDTCREWNDLMIYSGRIKSFGDGMELSRVISEGNVFADREDVFWRGVMELESGSLLELSQGVGTDLVPVYTDISTYTQRSLLHFASKEIVPMTSGQCVYKTIWHYDPAGWLSRLVPHRWLGHFILKNLIHEHQKLAVIFD